ncbi:hypothetical protein D3C81_2199500 [compost metagenome]
MFPFVGSFITIFRNVQFILVQTCGRFEVEIWIVQFKLGLRRQRLTDFDQALTMYDDAVADDGRTDIAQELKRVVQAFDVLGVPSIECQ